MNLNEFISSNVVKLSLLKKNCENALRFAYKYSPLISDHDVSQGYLCY